MCDYPFSFIAFKDRLKISLLMMMVMVMPMMVMMECLNIRPFFQTMCVNDFFLLFLQVLSLSSLLPRPKRSKKGDKE